MPTELLANALKIAGAAAAVVFAFWHKVLAWAEESFFPWVKRNIPEMLELTRNAFAWVDEHVAVPIRRAVKTAWALLRRQLLKMTITFEKRSDSQWSKRTTTWVIEKLGDKSVKKTVSEEELLWDDLPSDIREQWIRTNENKEIDFTDARDELLTNLT
jgi:hypothetical protein